MQIYAIDGVDVIEIKPVSSGNESLCSCPSCRKERLYVNRDTGLFQCKVCGLEGKAKIPGGYEPPSKKQDITPEKKIGPDVIHRYIDTLLKSCNINEFVRSYFITKKIPMQLVEEFGIGYSESTPEYEDKKIARALGLLNDKYNNRFYKRIVLPVKTGGKWVYLTSRSVGISSPAKYIDISLKKKIFREDIIAGIDTIYLCEGIPDTLSMIANGYTNSIGILGAQVFKKEYVELLSGKKIIICYDNDFAGRRSTIQISNIMKQTGSEVLSVKLEEDTDVGDFFQKGNKKLEIIPINLIEEEIKILLFSRAEPNLLVYGYGHYEVRVSDVIPRRGSMKATVSIYNHTKILASSNFDLTSMRLRASYAKEFVSNAQDVEEKEAKSMLMALMNAIKQNLKEADDEPEEKQFYIMSDKEREHALKLLLDDRLLFRVKKALDRQEVVGENINKILLYLIYTSRLMRKPISCLIKGLSSSGKTYLMGKVLSLIPPEGHITLQQASAKSLYYVGELDLKHKMIIIGEMHGAEEAQYSLREAQDGIGDGDLTIMTVEKDPDTNQNQTVFRRVSGPCGFVSSTTEVEINPENETRNFSIYVKIDEQKVVDTASPLIDKYLGNANLLSQDEILLFHNAQRSLQTDLNVKIPYIKYVLDKFPSSPIRVMRDRVRFCVLLETIAVIHQFQRKITTDDDGRKWIIASISDYNIALILMDEILVETIYELPAKSRDIYEEVRKMRGEYLDESSSSFIDEEQRVDMFFTTYKQIAGRIKMKADDIRRWSKPLFDSGYFDYFDCSKLGEKNSGGKGRQTKLVPVDKDFYQSFLPTPDEIANYFGIFDEKLYNPITGELRDIQRLEVEL